MQTDKQRNPSYFDSIKEAITSFEGNGEKGDAVPRAAIYKYCECMRSFTNKQQMLNQIRLELRKAEQRGDLIRNPADCFSFPFANKSM